MSRSSLLHLGSLLGVLLMGRPAQALTFPDWQSIHFSPFQLTNPALSRITADLDADGLTTLAEYLFASDPFHSDSRLAPLCTLSGGHLALTYRERTDLNDAAVWLQASDDLTHWATFNIADEIARIPGPVASPNLLPDYALVTLRDPVALAALGDSKRFLRLSLRLLPPPPLQAPANLNIAVGNHTRALLRWSDLNTSETGYAVEKLDHATQTWTRKATLGPDLTRWTDLQLDGYDGVAYRVLALSPSGDLPSASVLLADADHNTLPDYWELRYFGQTGVNLPSDANGNGVSNWLEYLEGTDPTRNFYQGVAPLLTVVQGNHQALIPGAFLPQPWKVLVRHPDGTPWVGAPVRFTATAEEGLLAPRPSDAERLTPALTVNADANGYAEVWLKCR
jgi:hypothetical protein